MRFWEESCGDRSGVIFLIFDLLKLGEIKSQDGALNGIL